MKKLTVILLIYCCISQLTCFASAANDVIPLDGTYVKGVITTLETERISQETNTVRTLAFTLDKPGKIDLHFISHVPYMHFKLMNEDEVKILGERMWEHYSPYSYSTVLEPGTYLFDIIKEAPRGMMGTTLSDDNVGEYRFKINYTPFNTSQPTINNTDHSYFEIGNEIKSYFSATNRETQIYQFNITSDGMYDLSIHSDIQLSYELRDSDENEIFSINIEPNTFNIDQFNFSTGAYLLKMDSFELGEYHFSIEMQQTHEDTSNEIKDDTESSNKFEQPNPPETDPPKISHSDSPKWYNYFLQTKYLPAAILLVVISAIIKRYIQGNSRKS